MKLDQPSITLEKAPDHTLMLVKAGERVRVQPRRCFPWRQPNAFISLADEEGKEQALIRDMGDLAETSRDVLEEAMAASGFTLEIHSILSLEKEIEIRNWRVMVGGQERTFQTELDEWPRNVVGGMLLIRDVAGDLYTITDPQSLDEKSRKFLWALT